MEVSVSNNISTESYMSSASVCVVGPDPALTVSGGVATHLRILSSLAVFSDAIFCDVGSRNGPSKASAIEIFRGYRNLRRRCESASFVLTNGSISAGSLLKVSLQLILLPRKQGRSVFVFFHGGSFERLGLGGRISTGLIKLFRNRVDAFYFLTEMQRQSFLKKVGVLPTQRYRNFSDSDVTLPKVAHGDVLNLLYVGRVTAAKGVFEIVDALEILVKQMPGRFRLIFVGDGDALESVRIKVQGVLEGAVEFKGYLQGAALDYEYQSADLVLLPSEHEGFPYVFIEAMRAGVPMVATKVGALPELIKPGENGYFVQKDKMSLVEAIQSYVEKDSECRERMRLSCYRCFTETLGRSSAEKFYRSLLGR